MEYKEVVVTLLEPTLCQSCRFAGTREKEGVRMIDCKRLACDNWDNIPSLSQPDKPNTSQDT